jgi:hypothetical protein
MGKSRHALFAVLFVAGLLVSAGPARAVSVPPPTPDAKCGPTDTPETTQGRTPLADFSDGRSNIGYTCNASQVSHTGTSGGYRNYRYTDSQGHVCGYYDSTLLFPGNLAGSSHNSGVFVLDMTDPAKPVVTDDLVTPAMQSPHESLSLNVTRGLLAADLANPTTYPGWVDIYSLSQDCRHPALQSSTPFGILGHEGAFSPDGNTFWVTSVVGNLTALDVSNPLAPVILYNNLNVKPHGLNISDDGNTLYYADLGSSHGLTVLDVSQVQKRVLNPQVTQIAHLTWDIVSIPQVPIPVTIGGHPYIVEIDEYTAGTSLNTAYDPNAFVGAARIIDIADPAHPKVISNIRLAVNEPANRAGDQQNDPSATSSLQGYAGHYCGVPQRQDPGIVACSFIMSGLRVFDIRDPHHPKEIAYFNMPPKTGTASTSPTSSGPSASFAMSQPAFDVGRGQVWYSDGNSGFYVVQISSSVWPFRTGRHH